ncbi:MAG: type VI secretion system tip protein TssI/VgrG [Limnobacter sp.]|nr:type VI secretion system tip protein TssI/VgrG [Limnobacter sp.]
MDQLVFRDATLAEALCEPSFATLTLESANPNLTEHDFLGQGLSLQWQTESGQRFFHGLVRKFSRLSDRGGSVNLYGLELSSWNARLEHTTDYRIYQNQSVVDIITDVFTRHGKGSAHFNFSGIGASYPQLEYCVQYGESDLHFVQRLMQREGLYYFHQHQKNSHCMVLCDHSGAHQVIPGYEELTYSPSAGVSTLTSQEVISSLQYGFSVVTPRHVSRDYNFKTPSSHLEVKRVQDEHPWNSGLEHFQHPRYYTDTASGLHYLTASQQAYKAQEKIIEGCSNARGVATGYLLTATRHELVGLSEPMLVTSTSIRLTEPGAEAGSHQPSRFECRFSAIPASVDYRPPNTCKPPVVYGYETAQVVGPEGEEVHLDEYGRIRVRFFWDRHIRHRPEASCWIRVAQPWAGNGWGFWLAPRVGQEVVVGFEAGNPDRPMVLGSVHNEEQKPPYAFPEQKNVSGWKSRSTKTGSSNQFNELRFDDTLNQEYIWFQAQRDFHHWVKRESHTEIGSHRHALVHGNYISYVKGDVNQTVDGKVVEQFKGQWSVDVSDDINIKTGGQMGMAAQSDLSVQTGQQASLSAGTTVELQAGVSISIGAGQSLSLKAGPSSIVLGPSGVSISGPNVSVNSGGGASGPNPNSPEATDSTVLANPLQDPLG